MSRRVALDPVERMRRHRLEFELALAENLSLADARARLAQLDWIVARDRLDARHSPVPPPAPAVPAPRWMMSE